MSVILAIVAAIAILAVGFALSLTLPRMVVWQQRTPMMICIWVISLVVAIFAFTWIV